MKIINVKGDIVVNEWAKIYKWLGWEHICPKDVADIIAEAEIGEEIRVNINSGGGHVMAGQEIYSVLSKNPNVQISVEGMACSAASVIAMAGRSSISPVGMLMVHNVSGSASGDYHEMDKTSSELKRMNEALANAYHVKSGMDMDKLLKLMDRETWLTANQCIEYGLIDSVEQPVQQGNVLMLNAVDYGVRLTPDIMKRVEAEMQAAEDREERKRALLADLDDYGI